jgi:hypothetical protein
MTWESGARSAASIRTEAVDPIPAGSTYVTRRFLGTPFTDGETASPFRKSFSLARSTPDRSSVMRKDSAVPWEIDSPGRDPLLETVRGHGYRLKAPS